MKTTLFTLARTPIEPLDGNNFNDDGGGLESTIDNIIQAVIGILGLACVIIIIIGGIQYMTSSGDAGKVKKAKDTIMYGIIGLVIALLAFAIVNFVLTSISGK